MGTLLDYAKEEFRREGISPTWAYGNELEQAVTNLINVFEDQHHSGGSAAVVLSMFMRLAAFQPLSPLTGDDEEWGPDIEAGLQQNKRYTSVFRDAEGKAYDINAVVYEDPEGMRFTRLDSWAFITFPYTPVTQVVKVDAKGERLTP